MPTPLEIHPLSGHTGAEIAGVDLATPLTEAELTAVKQALHRWKVVFFRGQRLGHAEQIAFARQFGELTYAHPYDAAPPDGFPEIYTVSTENFVEQYGVDADAAVALRRRYSYTTNWHTDVTPAVNPPAASILRADVVPDHGGDTTFTNLVAAYESLSPKVQEFVSGLQAEHRYGAGLTRNGEAHPGNEVISANRLVAHHPVVRVHPETGEKALFVNPGFTARIVDVHPQESRRILEMLFDQVTRAAYTVRFRWEPGSVAFWDNRATAHLAAQDLDHLDVPRTLHRVTLIGEVPVGADGRESVLIEGEPFRSIPVFEGPART